MEIFPLIHAIVSTVVFFLAEEFRSRWLEQHLEPKDCKRMFQKLDSLVGMHPKVSEGLRLGYEVFVGHGRGSG